MPMLLRRAFIGGLKDYATWNPSDKPAAMVLSNGNKTATSGGSTGFVRSTIGKSAGKWYWEIVFTQSAAQSGLIGVAKSTTPVNKALGVTETGARDECGWWNAGPVYSNGSTVASPAAGYNTADIVGVALDMDTGTLKYYRNNALIAMVYGLTGTFYAAAGYFSASAYAANFGATALAYSPPAGHNAGLYN